jgi:acetate kinase
MNSAINSETSCCTERDEGECMKQLRRCDAANAQFAILTINAGSSSVKLAVYAGGAELLCTLKGDLNGTGTKGARFSATCGEERDERAVEAPDHEAAANFVLAWLEEHGVLESVDGVGHRVVHGLEHAAPAPITSELIAQLHQAVAYAPEHLPAELRLIEAIAERKPHLPQVACFDTAFHSTMPRVARLLPIPRRYQTPGVRRYGFHGLSCEYLLDELARLAGPQAANGRVLLAHLGNGASITALNGGRSLDTTMGFTPAGLVMSTRSGDLDPGLVLHLARTENMTPAQFDRMVHHESGLLGISEISSDMRELLTHEQTDARAADAVTLFCYQARKSVGALATVIGGLDTLVFSAGIGERSAPIRARICDGLAFLGIELDERRNQTDAPLISTDSSRVAVRVIPTNEQLMIARTVSRVLGLSAETPRRRA